MAAFHNAAILVAAGKSSRMGGGRNKVLFSLENRPVITYSLEILQQSENITAVVVVSREEDRDEIESICAQWCPKAVGCVVPGGAERFDSVRNGLETLADEPPYAAVIHDAARPFLKERFITDALQALQQVPGCVVGVPLKDTLKETGPEARVERTHDRNKFWLAQTPQIFRFRDIWDAYRTCNPSPLPTDDGQVLEMTGLPVKMIMGSYHNIKITTPEDIPLAEALLRISRRETG